MMIKLTMKGRRFETQQEWWENFLLQGQFSVMTISLILVSIPVFPPEFAVACERLDWLFSFKFSWHATSVP